jgi:hypothetical protein
MRVLLWLGLFFLLSCQNKASKKLNTIQLSEHQQIIFLDSTTASQAIIVDQMEGFFDKVQELDMEIQLKKNFPENMPRADIIEAYKAMLQSDVLDFSPHEIFLIEGIFHKIYDLCQPLNPNIFPVELKLIKTKGKHYGDGVFYTRDNMIIIPKNELEEFSVEIFTEVMVHEIAHVYSRLHPEIKSALYDLIGFQKLNCTTDELIVPSELKERILLNPDGIDYTYAIRLRENRDSFFWALPIIASSKEEFDPSEPDFFNYIDFQLYPVKENYGGKYEVIVNDYGPSTINPYFREDFLEQIKDNTDYIIHPDEIIADNFKLLLLSQTNKLRYDQERLSSEGQRLLNEIEFIIMNN